PALVATTLLLSRQAHAFAALASAMLLAEVLLALAMRARWPRGARLVMACAAMLSSAFFTSAIGRAWLAAPLWIGAFAFLRPFRIPESSRKVARLARRRAPLRFLLHARDRSHLQ